MTSDDERWERDLRAGLGLLLDDVRTATPPVEAVLRKGRAMRRYRRLAVAACVATAAVAAVVIPAALRGSGNPQPQAPQVGKAGVVAEGRIGGHTWRIVVNQAGGRLCAGEVGVRQSCVGLRTLEHLSGPASLSGATVAEDLHPAVSMSVPVWDALFGIVRPDVTRIAMHLSDGRTVNLDPVAAAGYRWVGLMLRFGGPNVDRAIAYSGQAKIAYSVPFNGGALRPGTYFVSWYRPGEAGPAQQGRYIATGGSSRNGWDVYVGAGPWGYCVTLDAPIANGAEQNCWPPASLRARARVIMRGGAPPMTPRWIVATARPSVAYLRVTLANGRSMKVPVAVFSGEGFYAMQIGPGPAIVRWGAYNAAGHELYGGRGAPDSGS